MLALCARVSNLTRSLSTNTQKLLKFVERRQNYATNTDSLDISYTSSLIEVADNIDEYVRILKAIVF